MQTAGSRAGRTRSHHLSEAKQSAGTAKRRDAEHIREVQGEEDQSPLDGDGFESHGSVARGRRELVAPLSELPPAGALPPPSGGSVPSREEPECRPSLRS